jgi:hypothetical protein
MGPQLLPGLIGPLGLCRRVRGEAVVWDKVTQPPDDKPIRRVALSTPLLRSSFPSIISLSVIGVISLTRAITNQRVSDRHLQIPKVTPHQPQPVCRPNAVSGWVNDVSYRLQHFIPTCVAPIHKSQ